MADQLADVLRDAAAQTEERAATYAQQIAAAESLANTLGTAYSFERNDAAARAAQFRDTRWRPALLAWDGWADVKADGTPGTYDSITGIGNRMGTNGGYRAYRNLRAAIWDPAGEEAATLDLYGRGVTLDCIWPGASGVTATRYGNDVYQQARDGAYDGDVRDYVQSLPIGRNRRPGAPPFRKYMFPWHEADGYSPTGDLTATRAHYRSALKRIVGVAIREALAMGAHPGEFGAGGLLTGTGMDDPARWGWWYYGMDVDLLNSGMLVGAFDTYYKVEPDPSGGMRAPNIRLKLDRFTGRLAAAGITRYVLAETAMGFDTYANPGVEVGTTANLIDYTNQLAGWLATTGECAATFSKPDGVASKYGSYTRPGREAALAVLGTAMTLNGGPRG